MTRGERFMPVTVQRLHSPSVHVYRLESKRKGFLQAVEREMDFSRLFFYISRSSSQDGCIFDDKQSQRFCPCKYQAHQKTQAEKNQIDYGCPNRTVPLKGREQIHFQNRNEFELELHVSPVQLPAVSRDICN